MAEGEPDDPAQNMQLVDRGNARIRTNYIDFQIYCTVTVQRSPIIPRTSVGWSLSEKCVYTAPPHANSLGVIDHGIDDGCEVPRDLHEKRILLRVSKRPPIPCRWSYRHARKVPLMILPGATMAGLRSGNIQRQNHRRELLHVVCAVRLRSGEQRLIGNARKV